MHSEHYTVHKVHCRLKAEHCSVHIPTAYNLLSAQCPLDTLELEFEVVRLLYFSSHVNEAVLFACQTVRQPGQGAFHTVRRTVRFQPGGRAVRSQMPGALLDCNHRIMVWMEVIQLTKVGSCCKF